MSKNVKVYAVVLAGGSGTRFWPKSRLKTPKQLCKIGDERWTMIEKTLKRLDGYISPEKRIIVTHVDQVTKTKEIVGGACGTYIAEPEAKNTAAALAVAALEIERLAGDTSAVMVSLHADHVVQDEEEFRKTLQRAVSIAEQGYLTLVGIQPRSPETCYGYIERGDELAGGYRVANFREKPNLETAKKYLASGNYFWNSGYFVWRVDTLLGEFEKYLPDTLNKLRGVDSKNLQKVYRNLQSIAVDNAILEKSDRVACVEGKFAWHDVGSWDALSKCFSTDAKGNYVQGDVMLLGGCENTTVDAGDMFVACIGTKDLVVSYSNGAILVCPKDRSQDVKLIVEELKKKGRTELV